MKIARIIWDLLLIMAGLYAVLIYWGPEAYQQAHFQFTDRRGGPTMWPATLEMVLVPVAFIACLTAFSSLINRRLGRTARIAAGATALALLAVWVTTAVMWKHFYGGGPFEPSLLGEMWGSNGLTYILIALVSFGVAAIVGRGPLALIGRALPTPKS